MAENLVAKAYSLCQSGATALPAEISKPILDGCKNATDVVKKIPREVRIKHLGLVTSQKSETAVIQTT